MAVGQPALFSLEAIHSQLVAIQVPGISGKGIVRPTAGAWQAFADAAVCQGGRMERLDRSAVRRFEAHRDTIADGRRIAIGRVEHKERRLVDAPDGAGILEISNTLEADLFQGDVIKRTCFCQVVGADGDMGKNGHLGFLAMGGIGFSSGSQK